MFNRKNFHKWAHLCNKQSDQKAEHDQKSWHPPRHLSPEGTTFLISKTILPFFELYYIKILKYLLLKGTIYFLMFRTKLIIYLFTIWKENMYCWPTVAYAWYFKIFGWKFSKNILSWALVTFSRVTSGLVLLCIWCFGFQGGV